MKKNGLCHVLVSGAEGFIGSHLVEMLAECGCDVRALYLYNSFDSQGWLEHVSCRDTIEIVRGDVRDSAQMNDLIRDIDIVFNLAALISVPYSYQAVKSFVDTNISGCLNLLQAALKERCSRFIQISTSEVYGTARYVPIDEKHPLHGQSPYAASKIAADALALSFFCTYDLPVVVARPFNTFGPRQSTRAVIPTIITQIAAGRSEIELGEIDSTRDFSYVKDTCAGIIALAKADKAIGDTINIGSNREISIEALVTTVAGLMNAKVGIKQTVERKRPVQSEVRRLVCNNEKLIALSGFRPGFSLEQGLIETIAWFRDKSNLKQAKPGSYII